MTSKDIWYQFSKEIKDIKGISEDNKNKGESENEGENISSDSDNIYDIDDNSSDNSSDNEQYLIEKSKSLISFDDENINTRDLIDEKNKSDYINFYSKLLTYMTEDSNRSQILNILNDLKLDKFLIKLHPINKQGYNSVILLDQEDIPNGFKKGRLWSKHNNISVYISLSKEKNKNYYHLNINEIILTYAELYNRLELDYICSVNLELTN